MLLVVGLGNPGAKYHNNRHNVGFMVVDRVAERLKAPAFREKFNGEFSRVPTPDVVLLKPMTYMNLSGESVQAAMKFFKVALKDVLVVHDELDLAYGDNRLKIGGGTAGHNGLKSMVQHCGGDGFARLRIGIGRPRNDTGGDAVVNHVLGDFSSIERSTLPDVLDHAALGVATVLDKGIAQAMNAFNTRPKK
ncbi:MAG TPA: aminoacyl-tRNA hydrolase [Polyangiales bacterium]